VLSLIRPPRRRRPGGGAIAVGAVAVDAARPVERPACDGDPTNNTGPIAVLRARLDAARRWAQRGPVRPIARPVEPSRQRRSTAVRFPGASRQPLVRRPAASSVDTSRRGRATW
jgi:hypothetical protein